MFGELRAVKKAQVYMKADGFAVVDGEMLRTRRR